MSVFNCPDCGANSEDWDAGRCFRCGHCEACDGRGCATCRGEDRGGDGLNLLEVIEARGRRAAQPLAPRSKTYPPLESLLTSL